MQPREPIYIVSKGRWKTPYTANALNEMGVAYQIVVEEQEREHYAMALGADKVLVLDPQFQKDYDTYDSLGDSKGKGPGPARNFCWAHAEESGAGWHWVMDDNIQDFYRLNQNMKHVVADGTIFRAMEDFAGRCENLAMCGPNYEMFAPRKLKIPPLVMNTRIYSCNLIRNDLPYRWRGRYNEDTDLSLRLLKAGWCTAQFNAFLQKKLTTQLVKGGNTAEFYEKEGTLPKSQMLVAMHPEYTKLVHKFGRWHHQVDYRDFQSNRLRLKPDVVMPQGVNDYGMRIVAQ